MVYWGGNQKQEIAAVEWGQFQREALQLVGKKGAPRLGWIMVPVTQVYFTLVGSSGVDGYLGGC